MVFAISNKYNRLSDSLLGDILILMIHLLRWSFHRQRSLISVQMFQVYFIRTRFNEFLNGKSYVNDVGNNSGYNIDICIGQNLP